MRPLGKKGVFPFVAIAVILSALVLGGYLLLGVSAYNVLKENATIVIIILGVVLGLYTVRTAMAGRR